MRIDAHQHFWRYDAAEYEWIDESMAALRRVFLPDDLRREMRGAGFDASVAVQARQSLDETRWLLALAGEYPFIARQTHWNYANSDSLEPYLNAIRHPTL